MTDRARTTGSATTTTASAAGNRRRSPWAVFVRRLVQEKPLGLVGAVIIALFVLVSVFADILAPDPEQRQGRNPEPAGALRPASVGNRSHRA